MQLTGQSSDGKEITLNVCPAAPEQNIMFLDPDKPVEPALNPCFFYLSVRGFDRLFTFATLLIYGKSESEESDKFCGTVEGLTFCYTWCPSLEPGATTTNPTDIVCIVYNNGYPPNPNLLPSEIDSLSLVSLPSDSNVNDSFICGKELSSVRCFEPCRSQRPIMVNPAPNFCYSEISGTFSENIISKLYLLLQGFDRKSKERKFCTFKSYSEEGSTCSDIRLWCRPDSRGVWGLPPGETRCLMYLNGPAAAVGLLAATALSGLTSVSATGVGLAGIGTVGMSGALSAGVCPGPLFCTVQTGCCLVTMGINGLVCPQSC